MKNLFFALFISTVFFNCSSDKLPDNFESTLFECYTHEFNGYGKDINNTILRFENFLLQEKILGSNSASGYLSLIDKLTSQDNITLGKKVPEILLDELILISESFPHCMKDKKEDAEYLESRFAKMVKIREEGMEALKKSASPNMNNLRKEGLKFYTKSDLKQPFYKIRFMLDVASRDMSAHVQREKRLN